MSRWLTAAVLALGCCGAAWAGDQPVVSPESGIVRDADVSALFDYLRSTVSAAAEGREAPIPESLRQRAAELDAEVRMRGALAAILLLNELEAGTKKFLRDLQGKH